MWTNVMDIKDVNKITVFTDKLKPFNFNSIDVVDNQLIATKFTSDGYIKVKVSDTKWLIEEATTGSIVGRLLNEDNAISELHLILGSYSAFKLKQRTKVVNSLISKLIDTHLIIDDYDLDTLNVLDRTEVNVKFALLKQIVELKKQLIDIIDNENNS
jgi:hypothetical protein